MELWDLINESYISLSPSHIIYTDKILDLNLSNEIIINSVFNRSKNINDSNNNQVFNFKGYNLPLTMDFTT
jgi:hypothetical protein